MYQVMRSIDIFTAPEPGQEYRKAGNGYISVEQGNCTHIWDGKRIIRKKNTRRALRRIAEDAKLTLLFIGGIMAAQAVPALICRVLGVG